MKKERLLAEWIHAFGHQSVYKTTLVNAGVCYATSFDEHVWDLVAEGRVTFEEGYKGYPRFRAVTEKRGPQRGTTAAPKRVSQYRGA